ncbi:MAG TPA: type II secretion system F family protein [Anaerolineales bacterium]|nr:type II secretion system F family protein [Anaerolineales bacterium]
MQLIIVIVFGAVFMIAGAVFVFMSLGWLFRDDLTTRLDTFVSEAEVQQRAWSPELQVRSREITGSLASRILVPITQALGRLLGRLTPASSIDSLRRQLVIAGNPMRLGPREFYGLRIAFVILGLGLAYLVITRGLERMNILTAILILGITYIFPVLWLRMMVSSRQNKIRKSLPDALDMLSVCADAGLGFDQSLQRVSEFWNTAIALELGRVVAEMEMGVARRDALRNLADRLDISELSSFVSVIIQSEQLGMSIADTLHAQAEQMRVERRFRAQEIARTLPIKMLIPLAFLIFPAIIAVVLGPAIPPLIELFGGF